MPTEVIIGCVMLLAFMLFINIFMLADMIGELKGIRRAIMFLHWDIYERNLPTTKNDG